MALDFTALTSAVSKNGNDVSLLISLVEQLLAANPDPTAQAQLDAITNSVGANNVAIENELAKASGPTGATGTLGSTGADGSTGTSGPTGA